MHSFSSLQSSKIRLPPFSNQNSMSHFLHRSSILTYNPQKQTTKHRSLCIRALETAQPSDFEVVINDRFEKSKKLKIAIVGFGNFGQFLAKTLVRQGHKVLAHSRSDYTDIARKLGVLFFTDVDDLCEEHPEVVLICSSIISTESVLISLPLQRLKRSTLFVDVLSVKEFPRKLFLQILPLEFDVLCTHPMFGPESGKDSWKDLPFVYDKVRIGDEESRISRCDFFLDIFVQEGCRMVEMSCAEHDKEAAGSQFITHTMGRILEKFGLESTSINTKGYETLLNLVANTSGDSFELYYGLFMYNKNAMEQLERLDMAFESLKKQLFGHLHDILRKQLFENNEGFEVPKQLQNGDAVEPPIAEGFEEFNHKQTQNGDAVEPPKAEGFEESNQLKPMTPKQLQNADAVEPPKAEGFEESNQLKPMTPKQLQNGDAVEPPKAEGFEESNQPKPMTPEQLQNGDAVEPPSENFG